MRTDPPHSPPTPTPWTNRRTDDRTPDADALIGGHQRGEKRRDAHDHKGRNQRRLAADAIAVMPEDRGTDRPRDESNGVNRECLKRAGQGVRFRKEQLGEYESGYNAIEKKIVPLDGGANGRGNHGSPELALVFGLRKRRQSNIDRGHGSCSVSCMLLISSRQF